MLELTRREMEIAELVASGFRNPEICERLDISQPTLNNHLTHIYEKIGAVGTSNPRIKLVHWFLSRR